MIKFFVIILAVILVLIGVGIGTEISLHPNVNINKIEENVNGRLYSLPLENGIYITNNSNLNSFIIVFDSTNILVNFLSNVHYSAYFTNLTPHYVINKDEIIFDIIAFQPFHFTLTFDMHYTALGWFGLTKTYSREYKIILS